MRAIRAPLSIVASVLLVLTYLLIQSATPDPVLHERTLNALHALEIHDVELNRDLLRARVGLLPNYDPLVQAVDGLYRALETLRTGGEAVYGEASTEFGQDIESLTVAVTHKESLVDIFKSDNALLQNSLMYFAHASHELSKLAGEGQQGLAAEIGTLSNDMLRLMRNPQENANEFGAALLKLLEHLPAARSLQKKTRTLVAHGLLIVNMLPSVDGVLKRLLNAPTIAQARALQDAYLHYHGHVQARAQTFRILLYLVSVALLAYLIYLFARLRTNARALAEKSRFLQLRLSFESLITEISTHFINLPPDQVDDGIHHALKTLGGYAAVDRSYIVVFMPTEHAWTPPTNGGAPGSMR